MESQKCSICEKKMKWNSLLESWECHNIKCSGYVYTKNIRGDINMDLPSPAQIMLNCECFNKVENLREGLRGDIRKGEDI